MIRSLSLARNGIGAAAGKALLALLTSGPWNCGSADDFNSSPPWSSASSSNDRTNVSPERKRNAKPAVGAAGALAVGLKTNQSLSGQPPVSPRSLLSSTAKKVGAKPSAVKQVDSSIEPVVREISSFLTLEAFSFVNEDFCCLLVLMIYSPFRWGAYS